MKIVYLAIGKQTLDIGNSDIKHSVFCSYDEFVESGIDPIGFILECDSDTNGLSILKKLRKSLKTFLHPIFLHSLSGEELEILSDGTVVSLRDAFEKAETRHQNAVELKHEQVEYAESTMLRVLAFLYLRIDRIVKPFQQWSNPYLYSYPLIDILSSGNQDALEVLSNLKKHRFVRTVDLIDRVHHCPRCNYSHFNFVEVCPSCRSFNIEQKPFLHCFACGTVAPQERFLQGNGMICPQCNAQLRHIGAEYDRPLENYNCNDCGHFFQEPDVMAHCQNCRKKNDPDELVPRPVYSYQLTERGQYAVRTGELEGVYTLLDELQNINPVHFSYTVDWLLKICARHSEELFSVIGIRIDNIPQVHKKIGRYRLVELVDSYISRIRETIRSTDLTTHTSNDVIWILLPKTNTPNCEIVLGRILDLESLTQQDEGIHLEFKSVSFTAPDDMVQGEPGEQLLSRIEEEME